MLILSDEGKGGRMEDVLGKIYMAFALCITGVALPMQIWGNYRKRKCGLIFPLVFLTLGVYTVRALMMFFQKNWYVFAPDSFGTVMLVILMFQYFKYNWKETWEKIKNCNWQGCVKKHLSQVAEAMDTIKKKQ